jgi:TonB family protein
MTQRSAAQLNLSRKLLLASASVAVLIGPVVFGLLSESRVSAQSPQAGPSRLATPVRDVRQPLATATQDSPKGDSGAGAGAGAGSGAGNGTGSGAARGAGQTRTYKIGGDVKAPVLIIAPDPQYSEAAARAKFQGVCVLSLIVDAQGNPQNIRVVRHLGMGLDEKAVEAVRQYRFKPATLHNEPVAVQVNIEVNFRRR